jgi:hypothetical protein
MLLESQNAILEAKSFFEPKGLPLWFLKTLEDTSIKMSNVIEVRLQHHLKKFALVQC